MLTTRRKAITAALGAAWPLNLQAEPEELRDLVPSESASGDPAFVAFVEKIRNITSRKDSKSLLALMGPVFRVDFDFGKGPAVFAKRWKPQDPASELWRVLDRLLVLPAKRYDETLYVVSYVYGSFPIDLDPLGHVVTTGESVTIREEADATAKPLGTFSHKIVPTVEKLQVPVLLEREEWIKVAPTPGVVGYVKTNEVYSPAGYRAFFERQKGIWRWLSLVCAD
jgi:hypothetical protein